MERLGLGTQDPSPLPPPRFRVLREPDPHERNPCRQCSDGAGPTGAQAVDAVKEEYRQLRNGAELRLNILYDGCIPRLLSGSGEEAIEQLVGFLWPALDDQTGVALEEEDTRYALTLSLDSTEGGCARIAMKLVVSRNPPAPASDGSEWVVLPRRTGSRLLLVFVKLGAPEPSGPSQPPPAARSICSSVPRKPLAPSTQPLASAFGAADRTF